VTQAFVPVWILRNEPRSPAAFVLDKPHRPEACATRGVTLIEMLVVVTIIALFTGVVYSKLNAHADTARSVSARVQINNFEQAITQHKLSAGAYPASLDALRPFLKRDIPNDPWGRAYLYKYPGTHGEEPDIISYGADGQPGGEGINADIASWK
jgi:general secretion pathway protein G